MENRAAAAPRLSTETPPIHAPVSPFRVLSHLAVWAGVYVAASVACFAQIAGLAHLLPPRTWTLALVYAFCTAAAVYLLDRIKLADRWLDPADRSSHPARFEFLTRRRAVVRALILTLLLLGAAAGAVVTPLAPILSLAACVGVTLYAGRPRRARPRPKDLLLVKNASVAGGIGAFAILVTLAGAGPLTPEAIRGLLRSSLAPLAFSAAHLFARVWADAALCDLDDEAADRAFGTGTLATHFGRRRAWNTALALRLALAAALALVPVGPGEWRLAWALITVVSSVGLRIAAPARVRDWVDARFGAEAVAAAILAHVLA